jgi:hypothetical protein
MTSFVLENEDGTQEAVQAAPEATAEPDPIPVPESTPEASEAVDPAAPTSSEEVVEFKKADLDGLRDEAATGRAKAKRFDTLASYYVQLIAGRVLNDTRDLELSADLLTDGLPDEGKITAKAEAIAQERPSLAKVRGSVAQGVHSPPADSGDVDLHSMLRGW